MSRNNPIDYSSYNLNLNTSPSWNELKTAEMKSRNQIYHKTDSYHTVIHKKNEFIIDR